MAREFACSQCQTAHRTVARMERSIIRVRIGRMGRAKRNPSSFLRSTMVGFASLYPPYERNKGKRNAGSRTVVSPAPNGCGRATEGAACAARSAYGRARLPAFHHGSSQGVCGPLVRSGPGFVATPSKGRGFLRRRPDHFSDAPRMPVVMPADMMPGPPGSQADEAKPAGTALAPAARHHPDGVPTRAR